MTPPDPVCGRPPVTSEARGPLLGDDTICALCQALGPLVTSEFCQRCTRDLSAGLRHRRAASLRLPPLGDGARDPLDELGAA